MKTTIIVNLDTDTGKCIIQEESTVPATYLISNDSLESIAEDAGDALADFLEGLG